MKVIFKYSLYIILFHLILCISVRAIMEGFDMMSEPNDMLNIFGLLLVVITGIFGTWGLIETLKKIIKI